MESKQFKALAVMVLGVFVTCGTAFADGAVSDSTRIISEGEGQVLPPPKQKKKTCASCAATTRIDRSQRTDPYPATPFNVMSGGGGEASRYSTSAGWSRGSGYCGGYGCGYGYYGGYRGGSDIPNAGYTPAPSKYHRGKH